MKIQMTPEGVAALRDFSKAMRDVLKDMEWDLQKLLQTYSNVSDSVGPHKQAFLEMLQSIRSFQDNSARPITELSYMLDSTAEKMESYIRHLSPAASILTAPAQDIKQRYHSALQERADAPSTIPEAKALYERYKDSIRIVDHDYTGTPYYNSLTRGIYLNGMADMHNPTGNFSTYFHETGHLLDDLAGSGHTWLSSDASFRALLDQDAQAYFNKIMLEKHCGLEEAYDIISDEVAGVWCASISDIFGSLTGCRCQGDWGHHYTYWRDDPSRVEKEAFANMFEASIGSAEKAAAMRKYFPRAYSRFLSLLKEGLS